MIRSVVAVAIFPAVMAGSVAGALLMMDAGTSPAAAAAICQALAFLIVIVVERLVPYHQNWLHSNGDMRVDAAHALTVIATSAAAQPVIVAAGVAISSWLSARFGLGLWPHAWPLALQLCLAVVVVEAFQYWIHRWQHSTDWLWRFHATHHSAPRLYWLNASRFHFLDIFTHNIGGLVPLIAIGAPPCMLALWTLVSAVHGVFQHANLPLRLGPLNWLFSMAELHRWHHSPRAAEANHNYGQTLIIFDVLFGTRYLPKDREPPEQIGIESLPDFPMTYWAQLMSPFRWQQVGGLSASGSAPLAA